MCKSHFHSPFYLALENAVILLNVYLGVTNIRTEYRSVYTTVIDYGNILNVVVYTSTYRKFFFFNSGFLT